MNRSVTVTLENNIAIVKLEDRKSCNTFSQDLCHGLLETFEIINKQKDTKVVVIHGYDNYFCCGGTQEELLQLQAGKMKFTDLAFFNLLLTCPVPTIAAMQGHAIGGGFVFGCYADFIFLAEKSIYSTNFMKYGFTPGMGATYIIPRKLGETIGCELLYTADTYSGEALKRKGIPVPVLPKNEVLNHAMQTARLLADKPRHSLALLKLHLTQEIRKKLPEVINQEVAMHDQTFTHEEVKTRIIERF